MESSDQHLVTACMVHLIQDMVLHFGFERLPRNKCRGSAGAPPNPIESHVVPIASSTKSRVLEAKGGKGGTTSL